LWALAGFGDPSIRQRNAAAWPRVTVAFGLKHDGDVPVVMF